MLGFCFDYVKSSTGSVTTLPKTWETETGGRKLVYSRPALEKTEMILHLSFISGGFRVQRAFTGEKSGVDRNDRKSMHWARPSSSSLLCSSLVGTKQWTLISCS
jgi:hypothetical protein